MSRTFDWIQFASGRARFSGLIRGWDEGGHDTFAVEFDDQTSYGEINNEFRGSSMFVKISNFGYPVKARVGIPAGRREFKLREADIIRDLVLSLIITVDGYQKYDKPVSLVPIGDVIFGGDVVFDSGWIVISDA